MERENARAIETLDLAPTTNRAQGGAGVVYRGMEPAPAPPAELTERDGDYAGAALARAQEAIADLAAVYELRLAVAVSGRAGVYYAQVAKTLRWYVLGLAEMRADYVERGVPAGIEPARFVELAGRVAGMLTTGELDMMTLCSECGAWYDALRAPACPWGHDASEGGR